MVQPVPRDAYRDHLHALLPSGPAWPGEDGTTLDALLRAIAERLAEVDLSGANLLDEILPNSTFDLLPDWERVAGLPDICSRLGSTITVRRASLLEKLVTKPTLNASEFVRIGESFGVTITVEEHDQTRAEALSADLLLLDNIVLDVTGGKWRFVWWITIPTSADVVRFTMLSDFDTPFRSVERNTELECRLQNAAPAHTELFVEYVSVQPVCRACASSSPFITNSRATGCAGKTRPTASATCPASWRRPGPKRFRGSRSTATAAMAQTSSSFGRWAAPS